jgi:gp178|nr:MAG TPA: Protein of unknown function (DUF1642) [Caudoviricetes sp.]
MDRNEAVQKLATVGHLSMAHAEDLYDSIVPKPVVKQYMADWYEENKDDFEINLFNCICEAVENYDENSANEFENWLMSEELEVIQTLVNMHQFGYEVEKEKRYRVSMPKTRNRKDHAQLLCEADGKVFWCGEWYKFRTKFTRKELEENGFGWVFDCPGVEVEEVTDE